MSELFTPEKFVEVYSKAFLQYLANRNAHLTESHVVDLAIENSSFAEAFYLTVDAIN